MRSAGADTADVHETRHNHVLALPRYLWNAMVYPVGRLTIWAERKGLIASRGKASTEGTAGWFPYVVFGGETGTGEETGAGGGLALFHGDLPGRGMKFKARLTANRTNYHGVARYGHPGIGGGPWYWSASVEALDTESRDATINGEGALGGPEERFEYRQRDVRLIVGHRSNYGETEGYEPDRRVELRLSHGFRRYDDSGRQPAAVKGADEAIYLFSAGTRLAIDDRDYKPPARSIALPLNYQLPGRLLLHANDRYYSFRDTSYPERGGLIRIEADCVLGSGDVRYFRYGAEFQRFFTLFWRNRILALRARLDKAHALGDDSFIPYPDQPALGGSRRLRGYRRGFFRGEGSLLFSAEYRYPIWDTWNAFLFLDEGQVFDKYADLGTGGFQYGFGAGISVRTERAFLLGLRIARSEEERALTSVSLAKEF